MNNDDKILVMQIIATLADKEVSFHIKNIKLYEDEFHYFNPDNFQEETIEKNLITPYTSFIEVYIPVDSTEIYISFVKEKLIERFKLYYNKKLKEIKKAIKALNNVKY